MRVFVSEFLTGAAAVTGEYPLAMRHEGLAMLEAIISDLTRIPGCSVITILGGNIGGPLNAEVIRTANPVEESAAFRGILGRVDAALVIAPETDGILAGRCRDVINAGVTSWNCSPEAIELCGDKLRLANHLEWHRIPTISTQLADFRVRPDRSSWPVVLKPRDGAGSSLNFLIRDPSDWDLAYSQIVAANLTQKMIVQSWIPGRALSVGVNISFDGKRVELLPVGEQRFSKDGRFHYRGGRIPAQIPVEIESSIELIVRAACESIPGLAGFIGFDLILTEELQPLIVEINPRLTTAYIGYRRLFKRPLPERWFDTATSDPCEAWNGDPVDFEISEKLNSI